MRLKETKSVILFKFADDHSHQVNIYVEPTQAGQGRLIISTQYEIFQRYFDGCTPDIFSFLARQSLEGICGCFDISDKKVPTNPNLTYYDYLLKRLEIVWPQFVEEVKKNSANPLKA